MGEPVANGDSFSYNKHARNLPMFQGSIPIQQVRSIAGALLLFKFDIVVLKLVCRLLFSRLQDLMEASRVFIPKLSTTTLLYAASFGSTCWMMVPVGSSKILILKQGRCTLVQCSSSTYWIGWIQGYLQATMEWYWEHLKGEGHVVVRGYYVGLTVRLRFKNAPSDLSWRTKYMLPIIALLYFTRLGRRWVSFLATWLDPRLVVLKSAGEGLRVTVKTGVLTPRSYGRLEGSTDTTFLGKLDLQYKCYQYTMEQQQHNVDGMEIRNLFEEARILLKYRKVNYVRIKQHRLWDQAASSLASLVSAGLITSFDSPRYQVLKIPFVNLQQLLLSYGSGCQVLLQCSGKSAICKSSLYGWIFEQCLFSVPWRISFLKYLA
ncbi:hypothetical protein O0I10_008548 [Lichtheimia ornata]|uniref:Uncharacterized protein n=1 Tax=Lichtheimia ornata TaxID=688661 RepID=A0AAD7UZ15_9FUNG|nr:uncharacterized protein O0I10_008548 [Lichtheimia ornata]KAJ8655663.1 hypothetical protein O0I10_008548 [Lichtheimia ornata]